MIGECRPPVGTPDGAFCWLVIPAWDVFPATFAPHMWRHVPNWSLGSRPRSRSWWEKIGSTAQWMPHHMDRDGWRFHSLATPPEDKP